MFQLQLATNQKSGLEFSSSKLDPRLADVLSKIHVVRMANDTYALEGIPNLDPDLYQGQFKKLLQVLHGHHAGGMQHFTKYDPTWRIKEILDKGKLPKLNPYSLHETPNHVVEGLLDYIDLFYEEHLCEPENLKFLESSAGTGQIAKAIRKRVPSGTIHVCEVDPINQELLEVEGFTLIGSDWLKTSPDIQYDWAVINPPFNGLEYIDHILKTLYSLRLYGVMGAIAPASLSTSDSPKAHQLRNLCAQTGGWESIGAPFPSARGIECLQLKLENIPESDLQRQWERSNGMPSQHCEMACIAIDCHRPFDEKLSELRGLQITDNVISRLADILDTTINHLIGKEQYCLYWDEKVREQCIKNYAEDLQDELEN